MKLRNGFEYDTQIVEAIKQAVVSWVEGGGSEGNFTTSIFESSKKFYSAKGSEWRGAVLIYMISGAGLRTPKKFSVELKLLALDCVNAWDEHVRKNYKAGGGRTEILTDIANIKNYFLNHWGLSTRWCENVLDSVIKRVLREQFWISVKG